MSMHSLDSKIASSPAAFRSFDPARWFYQESHYYLPLEGILSFLLAKWDFVYTHFVNWIFSRINNSKIIQFHVRICNLICSICGAIGFMADRLANALAHALKIQRSCKTWTTIQRQAESISARSLARQILLNFNITTNKSRN